ncbi:MAG TPA: hypothetical protein VM557_09030 [Thermoanaerobaculia bacterium]|nr:hypothetical protein [Thermoanaerobaculia bacterium]
MKQIRRKTQKKLQKLFRRRCGWCEDPIGEDQEVFGTGAKVRSDVDLEQFEGQVIPIRMVTMSRNVLVAVAGPDSEAKRSGYDIFFMTCSEECGRALKQAFDAEIGLGDALGFPK